MTTKINTFSFHPWSVRHGDTSKNRIWVLVTEGSDVIQNSEYDIINFDPNNKTSTAEITNDEDGQIRLLDTAVKSWQINSKSAESNDYGYYSFPYNNCGTWATRMITLSGLQVPSLPMNLGTGLGYGMDYTGIPQSLFGVSVGIVATGDALEVGANAVKDATVDGANAVKDAAVATGEFLGGVGSSIKNGVGGLF